MIIHELAHLSVRLQQKLHMIDLELCEEAVNPAQRTEFLKSNFRNLNNPAALQS